MAKIPSQTLIGEFLVMLKEHWSYEWGKAERGCVDCSGAFVYAYEKHGMRITHGSNTIARKHVVELLPIINAKPGMAAFKARAPHDAWYDLPEKFKNDNDQLDYYHIGLVDNELNVLNAQSTSAGFTETDLAKWDYVAYLKDVDYSGQQSEEQEVDGMKQAIVTAENGDTVNMRDKPKGKLVDRLPIGTIVNVVKDDGEWMEIQYRGKNGYMMANYLNYVDAPDETAEPVNFDVDDLRHTLVEIATLVNNLIGKVG